MPYADPEKRKQYHKKQTNLWREKNPDKLRAQRKRANAKRTPEYCKWQQLYQHYKLTKEDYQRRLIEQNGYCPICRQMLETESSAVSQRIVVDHNHITGEVRGLVHNVCNRGIGMLKDDPIICRNAAEYLEGKNHGKS